MLRRPSLMALLAVVAAAAVAVPSAAAAQPGPGETRAAAQKGGNLKVGIAIKRFQAKKGKTVAKGTATAELTDFAGKKTTIRHPVTLTAKRGGNCRILTLTLDQLTLTLLGLNVNLSKVELKVTGNPRGGVLGSLFCRLARAKVRTSARAAARRLNAHLRDRPLKPIGFSVPLSPRSVQSSAVPACPVLDLVLGPLHLDLLGLIVDLNKVNLVITATPGGGVLGNLFCGLSK